MNSCTREPSEASEASTSEPSEASAREGEPRQILNRINRILPCHILSHLVTKFSDCSLEGNNLPGVHPEALQASRSRRVVICRDGFDSASVRCRGYAGYALPMLIYIAH